MAKQPLSDVLQHLRNVAAVHTSRDLPDCELLERFLNARDAAAFTVLIERHGPMVLGVCRRALPNFHDAEDACQATFLVLARKAASVRKKTSLSTWLHGVAARVAANLKRSHARRTAREHGVDAPVARDPAAEVSWREVQAILDEELRRLPERLRAPIILCYLECLTREDAAKQLGLSPTTLHGRLERARELLRECLAKRGLTLAATMSAVALGEGLAQAALAPTLVVSSTKAAMLLAAGQALTDGVVASHVVGLAKDVLKNMFLTQLKMSVLLGVCAAVLLGVIGGSFSTLGTAQEPAGARREAQQATTQPPPAATGKKEKKAWKERLALPPQPDHVLGVAYSAEMVAVISKEGGVKLWDAATGKERLSAFRRHTGTIGWMAFSPDGRYLYSSSQEDDRLTILIMYTATDLSKDGTTGQAEVAGKDALMVFAGDGEVWAQGEGNLVRLLKTDLADPLKGNQGKLAEELTTLKGHEGQVRAAAFSMDGKTVVTGADDKTVRLWDAETGKEKATFAGHNGPVVCVASAPDGKTLASVSTDGVFKLWDATANKEIRTPKDQKAVRCAAFSPDGKLVAVGGDDGIVVVLDVATGEEQARLRGHKDSVRALAFSPDGRTIISGSQDKTAKLWQLVD